MSRLHQEHAADAKLESLRDYRSLQLEVARGNHAKACALTEERRDAVDGEQRKIEDSHEAARAQMNSNATISADALTRIRHFTNLTFDELQRAQAAWQSACDEQAIAHTTVVKTLTDLRAVERLRDKRRAAMDRERARLDQKQLDDHALVRLARRAKQADADF